MKADYIYHFYVEAYDCNGKVASMDGLVKLTVPVSQEGTYEEMRETFAKRMKVETENVAIRSLSLVQKYEEL